MINRPERAHTYRRLPLLIVAITVASLVVGLVGLHLMRVVLIARTGEGLSLAAADASDRLDQFLFERHSDIQMMARALRMRDAAGTSDYLTWMRSLYPNYAWIAATDTTGRIVAATNRESVGQERNDAPWFQDARDHHRVVVHDAHASAESEGRLAVAFTAPILDAAGTFKGVVTSRVDLPALEEVFRRVIQTFQKQHAAPPRLEYLYLKHDGEVIADSFSREEGRANLQVQGLPSALRVATSDQPGYIQEEDVRRHVTMLTGYARTSGLAGFQNLYWGVLIRMDRDEVLAPIHDLQMTIGMAAFLLVAPLIGLLYWASGRLREEWTFTRGSEAWLFTTLRSIGDAVIATDANGAVTFMNPVAESLTGWREADAKGKDLKQVFTIVNEQTRVAVDNPVAKVLKTGLVVGLANHTVLIAKDGTERPIDDSGAPIRNEDGTIIGVVLVFRDVAERREAERLVIESRDFYLRLFEDFPALVWRSGLDARCNYFNKTWLAFTGRTMEKETGDGWAIGAHPDDLERCVKTYLDAFHARKPFSMVYRLRRHDGEYRYLVDYGRPFHDINGEFAGYIGSCYDITDQREAEERIRESERQLEKAQQLAHIGSWTWEVAKNRVSWSEELCRIFGVKPEEFGGTYEGYVSHLYPDDRSMIEGKIAQAGRDHKPFTFYHRVRRKDGEERILHAHGEVIVDEAGCVVRMIGTTQDVTELKQAEAALRTAHDDLERRVRERTGELARANAALQEKVDELEKFEDAVIGRELKMIALEKEIDKLKREKENQEPSDAGSSSSSAAM